MWVGGSIYACENEHNKQTGNLLFNARILCLVTTHTELNFFRVIVLTKTIICCLMCAHAVPCRTMVAGADPDWDSKKEQIACAVSRLLIFHRCLCDGLPQESVDDINGQHNGECAARQRAGGFYWFVWRGMGTGAETCKIKHRQDWSRVVRWNSCAPPLARSETLTALFSAGARPWRRRIGKILARWEAKLQLLSMVTILSSKRLSVFLMQARPPWFSSIGLTDLKSFTEAQTPIQYMFQYPLSAFGNAPQPNYSLVPMLYALVPAHKQPARPFQLKVAITFQVWYQLWGILKRELSDAVYQALGARQLWRLRLATVRSRFLFSRLAGTVFGVYAARGRDELGWIQRHRAAGWEGSDSRWPRLPHTTSGLDPRDSKCKIQHAVWFRLRTSLFWKLHAVLFFWNLHADDLAWYAK